MTRHLSIVGAIIHFLYVSKPFVDEVLRKPAQAKYTSFRIFILYPHMCKLNSWPSSIIINEIVDDGDSENMHGNKQVLRLTRQIQLTAINKIE